MGLPPWEHASSSNLTPARTTVCLPETQRPRAGSPQPASVLPQQGIRELHPPWQIVAGLLMLIEKGVEAFSNGMISGMSTRGCDSEKGTAAASCSPRVEMKKYSTFQAVGST